MTITFALPDLGEGLTESEIVRWHVAEGDAVALNQVLAEVETAKAIVELPSPYAGIIHTLYVAEGETLPVGAPLIEFEIPSDNHDSGSGAPHRPPAEIRSDGSGGPSQREGTPLADPSLTDTEPSSQREEKLDVLVGSIRLRGDRPSRTPRAWPVEPFVREPRRSASVRHTATPPVRRYAKQRGVNLEQLPASDAPTTRADIDAYLAEGSGVSSVNSGPTASTTGGVTPRRERVRGLRKHTAAAMMKSYTEVPHATVFLDVDVTNTLDLVRAMTVSSDAGNAPTFLSLIARAVLRACKLVPEANASFDADAGEIVYHPTVNLGIAMATPQGLVVASIDQADAMTAAEITREIALKRERAHAGTLTPQELTSSTVTLSNVGVFGVDAGVPIVNPGESVILAVGTVRKKPWEFQGKVALREVLTLSVSFDHRLIDGAGASAFITAVGQVLESPGIALAG